MDKSFAIKLDDVDKSFKFGNRNYDNLKAFFFNPIGFFTNKKPKLNVLRDLSLEIKPGEVVGIIGRNGSGKSTMLKILAKIYAPDQGEVKVNGRLVPFLELGVGFNPELTARDNIFLNGTILGMKRTYLQKKVMEIIEFAELSEFIDTPVKNFSSGMLVRLAFAIAVQSDADIYLLDEILAVGDAGFQQKSFEILRNFKQKGKTVVLVSHDLDAISNFCTRVVYLRSGKIVTDGKPQDVINHYLTDTFKGTHDEKGDDVFRWGSEEVRIQSVKILKNNQEIKTFEPGEKAIIKVDFEMKRKVDLVNIGVGVYDSESNFYVWGGNTKMDQYKIKGNSLELTLDTSGFSRGTYYINVVAFGDIEKDAYDFLMSVKSFSIIGNSKYRGKININHDWN